MPLSTFHPAVASWFAKTFRHPTAPQTAAWPAIVAGKDTLIAAPTGSGKTLAAFLAAIDALIKQSLAGKLSNECHAVYVSPLKALSNDIERNLQWPLSGIRKQLKELNLPDADLRVAVRTGDTTPGERASMKKRPPHILVTTPESLYLLLTAESGRRMLSTVQCAIVDEIHAIANSKRGSHLALSLERLQALTGGRLQRIGLSATQKPIEDVARFLTGAGPNDENPLDCAIIDSGHVRERDVSLVLPASPLEAVLSNEAWGEVFDQITNLITAHRTTLVFANTRRLTERVARQLSERLGEAFVAAHHGSLSKEQRLNAEARLKNGELKVLVATASLELGIDIGDVELVCQLGSPRSIATFLQRIGRANHSVLGVPKGRLFPLSRDDLVECVALLRAVRAGELDRLRIFQKPLDVLAQQIVAEVACQDWSEDELFALVTRAHPYRHLTRPEFDAVVRMLSEGFATRRGRRSAYLHRDAVNKRLRARDGARLTALTCGGAIPDNADYRVVLEPAETFVGTLNEDFAIESQAGDIFQLGNASYRILKIESGVVRVQDAKGAPPTLPFWLGEAPSRTDELSRACALLRAETDRQLGEVTPDTINATAEWFKTQYALEDNAARQLTEYLAAAKAMLGVLPTQTTLVIERFFDETGAQQLVVHSPYGNRVNRAFGLALRKRFCRQFNFELQAAANEDAIVLSLGETHSFALAEVAHYLSSRTVKQVLTQAVLAAPLFTTRWRWVVTTALAVKRYRGGRKNPPPLQRMEAEDLIAVVFPDQIACAENIQGEREIPDHPLVNQVLADCLTEAMDGDGLEKLLQGIESGTLTVIARDLPHPSPLSQEILNAKPYGFLDDAPLEERRTQAVMSRRWLDPIEAKEFGALDAQAIVRVREEAVPAIESAEELHDALLSLTLFIPEPAYQGFFEELVRQSRIAVLQTAETKFWVAAERLPVARALFPDATFSPTVETPAEFLNRAWTAEEAVVELVRGHLQSTGPVTALILARQLKQDGPRIEAALLALENEGFVLRGQFTPGTAETEWCERRLLARIHRYTVERLRADIEPVPAADFLRFLFSWHGIANEPKPEGAEALYGVLEKLEGFEAQASSIETDLLPARLSYYNATDLDSLTLTGRISWARLTQPKSAPDKERAANLARTTPIAFLLRSHQRTWQALQAGSTAEPLKLSFGAQRIFDLLKHEGALFLQDLVAGSGLLKAQTEEALSELVAQGLVHADSFASLRALILPADKRRARRHTSRRAFAPLSETGRWSLWRRPFATTLAVPETVEVIARTLLKRYGVVFKRLLAREAGCLPSWYDLLQVYRRLEARGDLRGGRFVAGMSGEQFALPEAVATLRHVRKEEKTGRWVSLSAADPLNLIGILTPGARVSAIAGNRVLYRDGVPIAAYVGAQTQFLSALDDTLQWEAQTALRRVPASARTKHGASLPV